MAEVLTQFPKAPTARYPWSEWLDGQVWALTPGVDFTAKVGTLEANARLQAKRRGGTVRCRHTTGPDGRKRLVIQFVRAA